MRKLIDVNNKHSQNIKLSMKILIAGASGKIGSILVDELNKKHEIIRLARLKNNKKVDYSCDLLDKNSIDKFLLSIDKIDILIFLVSSKSIHSLESEHNNNNFITLVNLMNAMDSHNKLPLKVIFTSTSHIYGISDRIKIYDENTSPNPRTPYSITKLSAEQYLFKKYPYISYILRLSPVYSESMMFNLKRRVFIKNIPYIVSKGDTKFSLCNINNLLNIIIAIIDGKVPPNIYNVSDPNPYCYIDLHKFFLSFKKKKFIFKIPYGIVRLASIIFYSLGLKYLYTTSSKLIFDSIFTSKKIRKYVNLNHQLNDLVRR